MNDTTTIPRNSASAAIAIRFRTSLCPARAHGLRPPPPPSGGASASGSIGCSSPPTVDIGGGLLHPGLVDQDATHQHVGVEDVVADSRRHEVDVLGQEQRHPGRLVGGCLVGLGTN